ncbi:GHMP kinase [Pseudomethylobacillus aquaticus]|uniref:GHMP kinase n=1 Tax=Pseudomethylobacillus aquaticus TaxID=2676064 RepID=A0A3N0UXY8_9PROT|nr:beta-ribofuranosylaminobenzene 5'-phosphate synthase family protein [Pseudomethylobacillus aquaticus]ROH85355.1 GHMP kinase [Pseudomethylobacillus aquaticus]
MSGLDLPPTAQPHAIQVTTTGRLHLGFFDLNGGLGRRFGSIGLSLDQPLTAFTLRHADAFSASGPGSARALKLVQQLALAWQLPGGAAVHMQHCLPEHSGLGSGTQLALALGSALGQLHGRVITPLAIAEASGRGRRSGIGIGTFVQGGVIVDGGRNEHTRVPPVIARMAFPDDWRVLLILDQTASGIHGSAELEAFRRLPEFPAALAAELCRYVLMQALPALAEHDLAGFGSAIQALQQHTGDHFAAAQGGRYASARVAAVLDQLQQQGVHCFGQSSWGPTGFAIFASQAEAEAARLQLGQSAVDLAGLEFLVCRGRNQGAELRALYTA